MGTGTPGWDMSATTMSPTATSTGAGAGAIMSARRPAVTATTAVVTLTGAVVPSAAVVLGAAVMAGAAAILLRRFLVGRADAADLAAPRTPGGRVPVGLAAVRAELSPR